jgi:hypothetical protein
MMTHLPSERVHKSFFIGASYTQFQCSVSAQIFSSVKVDRQPIVEATQAQVDEVTSSYRGTETVNNQTDVAHQ